MKENPTMEDRIEELVCQFRGRVEEWTQEMLDVATAKRGEGEKVDPAMVVELAPEGYLILSEYDQLSLQEEVVTCYRSWEMAWPFVRRKVLDLEMADHYEFRIYEVRGEKLTPDFTTYKTFCYSDPGQIDSVKEEQVVLLQCVVQPTEKKHIRSIRVSRKKRGLVVIEEVTCL